MLPARVRALGWAIVWTAAAVVLERWTPRFPGDLLEYTQWRFLSLLQIASIAGPHGLGFIIAFFNAALAQAWDESQGGRVPAASATPCLALATALAASAGLYGAACFDGRSVPAHFASVEILQPNIDQYQKWDEAYVQRILGGFDELLARPRAAAPRLIVWPESSLPRWVAEMSLRRRIWLGRKLKTHQVIGVACGRQGGSKLQLGTLIDPDGAVGGKYHKRDCALRQYVPLPWLGAMSASSMNGRALRARAVLETPVGPAAVSLCEILFGLVRFDASRGAIASSSASPMTAGTRTGPYKIYREHLPRRREPRDRDRSGNTGISGVIDPWGRVLSSSTKRARPPRRRCRSVVSERSFYSRHGGGLA